MKFKLIKQSDTVYFFHQVLIETIKANNCFIHTPQPLQTADYGGALFAAIVTK